MRNNLSVIVIATLLLLFMFASAAGAPAGTQQQPAESASPAQTPPPTAVADLTVKRVAESQIAVNSTITVIVEGLDKWLQQPNHDGSKFVLTMDGNELADLPSAPIDIKDKDSPVQWALRFDLLRKPSNRAAWTAVFSRRKPGEFSNRNVAITVKQTDVRIAGQTYANLRLIDWTYLVWFCVFAAAFAAAFGVLCYKSDMIRIPGEEPKNWGFYPNGKPFRKAYSLARTQMAFWFFAAIVSYAFIWIVTGYQITIPVSVLTLIGISAATGLASAVVDSSKRTDQETTLRMLQEKRKAQDVDIQQLQSEINSLNASLAASPPTADPAKLQDDLVTKSGQLSAKQAEIPKTDDEIKTTADKLKPLVSKNFISDVLSDDDGVSFHRLQIFAWTIVLIMIFAYSVYDVLAMPDFDTTLLGLMGISGGTYIGFKLPNQQG